jgi:hypothetical protein
MAIVHGKKDSVVRYSTGVYAHNRFIGHGFGKVKLINPNLGHPYDFLPINHAIEYLDMMTTDDATELVEYAASQAEQENWREVGLAIQRAKAIDAPNLFASITETYESEARKEADKHTKAVTDNLGNDPSNDWVDDFIAWTDQFGTSNAAAKAMAAWKALQDEHTKPAAEAMKSAKKAFAKRQSEEGYKYYEEIATKYYAAPTYRQVRQSLEKRKQSRAIRSAEHTTYAWDSCSAVMIDEMPPRGVNFATSFIRRGSTAATMSSRRRFVTSS